MEPKLEMRTKMQEMGMLILRKRDLVMVVSDSFPAAITSELLQLCPEKMALSSQ